MTIGIYKMKNLLLPAHLDGLEILVIIDELIEPIKRVGGVCITVSKPADEIQVVGEKQH